MRSYNEYRNQALDLNQKILHAARSGDASFFQDMDDTKRQLAITAKDKKGYSALMLACYHGHTNIATILLDAGANPNDSVFGGNTVLMGAAFKGHANIARLLLSYNADPKITNEKGLNALLYAQMFGRAEVQTVLEKRSNTDLQTKLKAWLSYFKLNLTNEGNSHV